jgi:hypothetical protein
MCVFAVVASFLLLQEILKSSGLKLITARDLDQAAEFAVKAIGK